MWVARDSLCVHLFRSCGVLGCEREREDEETDAGSVDRPSSPLGSDARAHIEQLLAHLDTNKDGSVTVEEAVAFFLDALPDSAINPKTGHAGADLDDDLSNPDCTRVLFDADENHDGILTMSEFLRFFERQKRRGHSDEDIVASCDSILENGTWGAWRANRLKNNGKAWEVPCEHRRSDGANPMQSDGPACSELPGVGSGATYFLNMRGLGPVPPRPAGPHLNRAGPDEVDRKRDQLEHSFAQSDLDESLAPISPELHSLLSLSMSLGP